MIYVNDTGKLLKSGTGDLLMRNCTICTGITPCSFKLIYKDAVDTCYNRRYQIPGLADEINGEYILTSTSGNPCEFTYIKPISLTQRVYPNLSDCTGEYTSVSAYQIEFNISISAPLGNPYFFVGAIVRMTSGFTVLFRENSIFFDGDCMNIVAQDIAGTTTTYLINDLIDIEPS